MPGGGGHGVGWGGATDKRAIQIKTLKHYTSPREHSRLDSSDAKRSEATIDATLDTNIHHEMKEHILATIDTKARDKHTTEAAIWLGEMEDAYALVLEAKRKKGRTSASASSSS